MALTSYGACDLTYSPPDGVCPDSAFLGGSGGLMATNNLQLVSASRESGITTLFLTRPLLAVDPNHDIAILSNGTRANFIWAHGPVSPG